MVLGGASLVEVFERLQLVGPAEEGEEALGRGGDEPGGKGELGAFDHSVDVGCPADLDQLDRVGQTLQVHLAQRHELLGGVATGQGPSHGRGQDLAALGVGAEPGRFDDRLSEVVPVFFGGFAVREPHPDGDRLVGPAVVTLDRLLHPDGTGQGPAQAGEGDHEPVAQVLHLDAAGGADGRPQEAEVGLAQIVGRLGVERGGQLGGTHHVGEEDGDRLSVRQRPRLPLLAGQDLRSPGHRFHRCHRENSELVTKCVPAMFRDGKSPYKGRPLDPNKAPLGADVSIAQAHPCSAGPSRRR